MEFLKSFSLSGRLVKQENFYLERHQISTKDGWFDFEEASLIHTFYRVGKIRERNTHASMFPGEYLRLQFYLEPLVIMHSREMSGVIELVGTIGGVVYVVMTIFGAVIDPISKHNFILNASKQLFLARTKTEGICKAMPKTSSKYNKKIKKAIKDDKEIVISPANSIKLFLANNLCGLFKKPIMKHQKKFQKLYTESEKKLAQLLDIGPIAKNMRNFEILLKNTLMT
jgi:hypothetical protein